MVYLHRYLVGGIGVAACVYSLVLLCGSLRSPRSYDGSAFCVVLPHEGIIFGEVA
jgi:hypothetical protein